MGLPLRDYRFATPYEKEWDRSFALAMHAMRDPRSDEAQMLGESVTDDISDLLALLCEAVHSDDALDLGFKLRALAKRHAEAVAEREAERACEWVPREVEA